LHLTVAHAVEKVLFRIALRESGIVPLCRAFLELPFSLQEVEQAADKVADGVSVVKNEWGEFLTYEFPELMRQQPVVPATCPTCGGAPPPAPTEGGKEVRPALICDGCYRGLRTSARGTSAGDSSALSKVKKLFSGGGSDDAVEEPAKAARIEHELFFLGLSLGVDQFTHTTIAAQSRLPASELKNRLDRMASRRYIHVGLLPSGDAVGYRFPPNLSYPRSHYARIGDAPSTDKQGRLRGLQVTPVGDEVREEKRTPPPPPPIKIVVTPKDKRGPRR
jgi:hypothetical protein